MKSESGLLNWERGTKKAEKRGMGEQTEVSWCIVSWYSNVNFHSYGRCVDSTNLYI